MENAVKYPYRYETHLHTSQGSACGKCTGEEMAEAYKEAGYTGIFVTDHFFYGNTAVDRSLPWEEWVESYCKGFEQAKKTGDRIGLQVFFGWEASYNGIDFLVYGLDKQWLKSHPEIRNCTVEEQYKMAKRDGGMVIHAHPFREADYIPEIKLYPEWVDGVEVVNSSHRNPDFNTKAYEYAEKYDLPQTGGSDIHSTNLTYGGMAFARPLKNIQDFQTAVINREGIVLPGEKLSNVK